MTDLIFEAHKMANPILAFEFIDEWRLALGIPIKYAAIQNTVKFFITAAINQDESLDIFKSEVSLDVIQGRTGHYLIYADSFYQSSGASNVPFKNGRYLLQLLCEGYQSVKVPIDLDFHVASKDLELKVIKLFPGPSYQFKSGRTATGLVYPNLIRGTIIDKVGEAVSDAKITSQGLSSINDPVTGPAGDFVLAFPPDQADADITLSVVHNRLNVPFRWPKKVGVIAGQSVSAGTGQLPITM